MSDTSREAFEAWASRDPDVPAGLRWDSPIIVSYERCWQASRAAALEEAEKACEEVGDEYDRDEGHRYPELKSDAVQGARSCESAIRELAAKG